MFCGSHNNMIITCHDQMTGNSHYDSMDRMADVIIGHQHILPGSRQQQIQLLQLLLYQVLSMPNKYKDKTVDFEA